LDEWWDQFQDDPNFWSQGQDVVPNYNYSPYMTPLGGYDLSNWSDTSGGSGSQMFYDTQTGQMVTAEQAYQLDPSFSQNLMNDGFNLSGGDTGGFNLSSGGFDLGGNTSLSPSTPSLMDRLGSWITSNPGAAASLGVTALTSGLGIAGIIQKAAQGDTQAKTVISRAIAGASPEEQQAYNQALSGFQTLQNYSLGSPTSLMAQLGSRVPGEEGAFNQAVGMAGNWGNQVGQFTGQMSPMYQQGIQGLSQGQTGILNSALPTLQGLAQGNLPPAISQLVEQAYQPQFGDLATNLIEQARNRGFAGGADLLAQAPASQIGQTALRDLQGQMANSKLQAGLQMYPQMVGQASGAYSTPLALQMQGMNQLGNLNQNIISALGGIGQQGMQNRTNFLQAATAPLTGQANIGSSLANQRFQGATTTQTTSQPWTLLDAFQPLSQILGGAGGALSGLGQMNLSGV